MIHDLVKTERITSSSVVYFMYSDFTLKATLLYLSGYTLFSYLKSNYQHIYIRSTRLRDYTFLPHAITLNSKTEFGLLIPL